MPRIVNYKVNVFNIIGWLLRPSIVERGKVTTAVLSKELTPENHGD